MKKRAFLIFSTMLVLSSSAMANPINSDCTLGGIFLGGKVEIVNAVADFKVEVVSAGADLQVEKVNAVAYSCGEWEFVNGVADFQVEFVSAGADFQIEFVNAGPGL